MIVFSTYCIVSYNGEKSSSKNLCIGISESGEDGI